VENEMPASARPAPPATLTVSAPAAWPRWAFRVTATVSAVMLFDQAVFAGQFLNGQFGSLQVHRENATYAGIAVIVTAVVALLVRLVGRGTWRPFGAYLGLFALVALQIVLGFFKLLWLHVPLGVAMIVIAVVLAIWSWRGLE
jgi:hypothetical protein